MKAYIACLALGAAILGAIGTARAGSESPRCATGSITCITIDGAADRAQQDVPITFGQPFAPGDVPRGSKLAATDGEGRPIPLQLDRVSSHRDGSVRFAILSAMLPELKDHETLSLSLAGNGPPTVASLPLSTLLGSEQGLSIDVALHSPQVTQIIFGNRQASTPGLPFQQGEIVTVKLGDDPADSYSITVTPEMAGGDFPTLTKIAEAMTVAINKGRNFRAYRIGEGGGYEKLWVVMREAPGRGFNVAFSYKGRAKLTSRNLQNWAPTRHLKSDSRSILEKGGNSLPTWLKGPVATEFNSSAPLRDSVGGHPHLTAYFDVRLYVNGQVRTDVTLENNWAYEPQPSNLRYDITISRQGKTLYQKSLLHYRQARWHKIFWSGAEPAATIRYDVPYFIKSRAVSNYDSQLRVSPAALAGESRRLASANTEPMGPAFITPYMPMTGGREDIAPLPRWTVLYLLSQDQNARAAMLANADASGGIPIHYRDRTTGLPVSLDSHPGIAMLLGTPRGKDALPTAANGDTPWTPDSAHQPSLAYLPYLVTGDRFYLEELLFWANWVMGAIDPGYREGGKGLVHMNQIRGQAWSMRVLGEAAMALPDDHPMKGYFVQKLQNNLQWYADAYPRNRERAQLSPLGWVERPDVPGSTPPWQDDFLALVFGHLAEAGYPLAEEFFRWQAQSTVGRWTHEGEGYCWTAAPGYYLKTRARSGAMIRDWGTFFRENWPQAKGCPARFPPESYPDHPAGSVAFAAAMLAISTDFEIPGAAEAYERLQAESRPRLRRQTEDPSWAIVPRKFFDEKAGSQ